MTSRIDSTESLDSLEDEVTDNIIKETEVIDTIERKPSDKLTIKDILPEQQHKTRNLIAKAFVFSYLIFVGFFLLASLFVDTTTPLSILEKLSPIIALIIGFYFGEKYTS